MKESSLQLGRRKRPRLAATLKVAYRGASHSGVGHTLDFSTGGMFLQVPDRFFPGDSIELHFHVALDSGRRPVQCLGEVVRVVTPEQASATGLLPGIGLRLHGFSHGFADLSEYIARRLGIPVEEVGDPSKVYKDLFVPPPASKDAPGRTREAPAAPRAAAVERQARTPQAPAPGRAPAATARDRPRQEMPAPEPRGQNPRRSRDGEDRRGKPLPESAEAQDDWRSQIQGRHATELIDLIEQAKAQVATKPASRWRLVLRSAGRISVSVLVGLVLLYALMALRLIPRDLVSWEETAWHVPPEYAPERVREAAERRDPSAKVDVGQAAEPKPAPNNP
jgi:hypothetical protein